MKKIDVGTIARLIFLVLSFINVILTMYGYNPLPADEGTIYQLVSLLCMGLSGGIAYWKNNNHTEEALEAQKVLDIKKAEKRIQNAIIEPPKPVEETLTETKAIINAVESTPNFQEEYEDQVEIIEREVDNRGI